MWTQNSLYGVTATEFTHRLRSFPLAAEPVTLAALNTYRDIEMEPVK